MITNYNNPSDRRHYPERWPLRRAKDLFTVVDERSQDGSEELLTVSHKTGITPRKNKNVSMFMAENLTGYKKCAIGDIPANIMWMWQGAIGVSKYEGIVSPAYYVYRQKEDFFNPRYLDLLLREKHLVDVYHSLSTGLRPSRLRLYPEQFFTINLPVPPRAEQEQIVRYLDWKCSVINQLITIRKNELDTLRDFSSNMIRSIMSNGLNKKVQKIDSNIKDFGFIPSNWKTARVKSFVRMNSGKNLTSLDISKDGIYPVYGGNGLRGYYSKYNYDGQYILIGRQGALAGNVHMATDKFWATDHALIVTMKNTIDIDYFYYLLISLNLNQYAFDTSAQPGLAASKILNLRIAYTPDPIEQKEIAQHIKRSLQQIDEIHHILTAQIQALQKLKKRLISNVIAGQLDVRQITVPNFEYTEEFFDDTPDETDEDTPEEE